MVGPIVFTLQSIPLKTFNQQWPESGHNIALGKENGMIHKKNTNPNNISKLTSPGYDICQSQN